MNFLFASAFHHYISNKWDLPRWYPEPFLENSKLSWKPWERKDMFSLGLTLFLNKGRTKAQGQERQNMSEKKGLKRERSWKRGKFWSIHPSLHQVQAGTPKIATGNRLSRQRTGNRQLVRVDLVLTTLNPHLECTSPSMASPQLIKNLTVELFIASGGPKGKFQRVD